MKDRKEHDKSAFFEASAISGMSIPISVIVSTRNRVDSLRRCVQALASVNTDYKWELVIVDNGSNDGTNTFLAALPKQIANATIITAFEPRRGLGIARNKGVSLAAGDILAFTDDDCYVSENYIDAMISAFDAPDIGFVGGRVLLYDKSDIKITIKEDNEHFLLHPRTFAAAGTIHGANMAFRRTTLDRIGGFDEQLGAGTNFSCEDIDAFASSLWAGIAGAYDPRPMVYHHHGRKTKRDEKDLLKTYDKGRGAYYAKYILRHDSRRIYLRSWFGIIKRGASSGGVIGCVSSVRQACRELGGALHYVFALVTRFA